jgi:hypothetical protein
MKNGAPRRTVKKLIDNQPVERGSGNVFADMGSANPGPNASTRLVRKRVG